MGHPMGLMALPRTLHEARGQVLQHDAIRGGKEGEDIRHKVALIIRQLPPVPHVLAQIHLLCRPVTGLRLLVVLEAAVVSAGKRGVSRCRVSGGVCREEQADAAGSGLPRCSLLGVQDAKKRGNRPSKRPKLPQTEAQGATVCFPAAFRDRHPRPGPVLAGRHANHQPHPLLT